MLKDKFKKTDIQEKYRGKIEVPELMFQKCESCGEILYMEDIREQFFCCPKCGKHFRVSVQERLKMVGDPGSILPWEECADRERKENPMDFPGYEEKLRDLRSKTGLEDAVWIGEAKIFHQRTALGIMSSEFLMGSMGTAVGEKITQMVERATREKLPVILFCCSGGARMQEGIFSLMQMAKISQALKRHDQAGLLYIPVLTDPTTGGVTASFAMLGDVILAEPGALIGFAGPRVIKQTIGQRLPEGFQSAEFLQKHGFVDHIAKRSHLKKTLATLIRSSCKS